MEHITQVKYQAGVVKKGVVRTGYGEGLYAGLLLGNARVPFESQHENFYPCTSSERVHKENVDPVLNRKTDFIQ